MEPNNQARIAFIQIEETTYDNLVFVRENMETAYGLHPDNIDDVIATLVNFWFDGKRTM